MNRKSRKSWKSTVRAGRALLPLLLASLVACASDDFSRVGSGLPLDVGQEGDSVLVFLDPPLLPTSAQTVAVDLLEDYEDRAILYLGHRDEGAWVATPLFRLDFDQATLVNGATFDLADSLASLPIRSGIIERARFRVRQTREDAGKQIKRLLQIREVAGNPAIDASLLDQDISTLRGTIVGASTDSTTMETPVDLTTAIAWYTNGGELSVMLQDLSESQPFSVSADDTVANGFERPLSNFVSLASIDYTEPFGPATTAFAERGTGGALTELAVSEILPKLIFDLDEDSVMAALGIDLAESTNIRDVAIEVPVIADMSHLQHDLASVNDLQMGTYRTNRIWLDFDITSSAVPSDATVNQALLTLHVRPGSAIGGERFLDGADERVMSQFAPDLNAFEVSLADASAATTVGLDFVLNSNGNVNFFPADDKVQVNVTDFVQRDANLLLAGDLGIMVRMNAAPTTLNSIEFYGNDAPDSLKPRLEIRFTPPADFWE